MLVHILFVGIILCIAALGIIVALQVQKKRSNILFLLVVITIFFWLIANYALRFANNELALTLLQLSFALAALLLFCMLVFSLEFPKQLLKKTLPISIIAAIPTALIVGMSFTRWLIIDFKKEQGNFLPDYGPGFTLFIVFALVYAVAIFLALYFQHKTATGILKQQTRLLFLGIILSASPILITDLLVPIVFSTNVLSNFSPLGTVFFVMFTTYAVVRHRLFDIQIQLQRIINIILPVIITTGSVTALAYLLHGFTDLAPVTIGVIVIFIALIMHGLLKYIFTTTRLSYILFSNTYKFHTALTNLANTASNVTDFEQLLNQIEAVFMKQHIQSFAFVVIDDQVKRTYHVYKSKNIELAKLGIWTEFSIHPFVYEHLLHTKETLVMSELPYLVSLMHTKLQQAFAPLADGVCIPLIISNDLVGIILLGAKPHAAAYTSEDIAVFSKISPALAMAVTKSILFTQSRNRVDELTRERNNLKTSIEELQRMKGEFLHIVDHQFNTPLSIIRSAFSMMEEGDVDTKEISTYIKGVSPRIKEFQSIVQAMLEAAHLEGDTANMNFAPVDVATVIKAVTEQLQPLVQTKHVQLTLTLQPQLPRITSDPDKFTSVISTLLQNALIYGRDGIVTVTASQLANGHVQIQIKDQGRGFDTEETKHIGEKFYRGKDIIDYHANGSGLGVHNAKKIIVASGGTLIFTSQGPTKGSTFTIDLPKGTEFLKQMSGLQNTTTTTN